MVLVVGGGGWWRSCCCCGGSSTTNSTAEATAASSSNNSTAAAGAATASNSSSQQPAASSQQPAATTASNSSHSSTTSSSQQQHHQVSAQSLYTKNKKRKQCIEARKIEWKFRPWGAEVWSKFGRRPSAESERICRILQPRAVQNPTNSGAHWRRKIYTHNLLIRTDSVTNSSFQFCRTASCRNRRNQLIPTKSIERRI